MGLPRRLFVGLASAATCGALCGAAVCLLVPAYAFLQIALAAMGTGVALVIFLAGAGGRARPIGIALVVVGLARIGHALRPADAEPRPEAPVRTRFLGEPARPWFAGIPEGDVVAAGAFLGVLPRENATAGGMRGLQRTFQETYDEIARDALFERPESPLLDSWLVDRGHYYSCEPEGKGPFPLLVFLHGSGGSFQAYPAWFALAARARGIATAFPANGIGHWRRPGAADRVAQVIEHASRGGRIDARRVFVCGLSAGAPAVFEAARLRPGTLAGLVSLSGVPPVGLEPASCLGSRVLIVHGALDHRCSFASARRTEAALRSGGVDVSLLAYPEDDHFLLLTRRAEVVGKILDFVAAR